MSSSPSATLVLNDDTLEPVHARFWIADPAGNTNFSDGSTDGVNNRVAGVFKDATLTDSFWDDDYCILHKKNSSGSLATQVRAACTGFGTGEVYFGNVISDVTVDINFEIIGN